MRALAEQQVAVLEHHAAQEGERCCVDESARAQSSGESVVAAPGGQRWRHIAAPTPAAPQALPSAAYRALHGVPALAPLSPAGKLKKALHALLLSAPQLLWLL